MALPRRQSPARTAKAGCQRWRDPAALLPAASSSSAKPAGTRWLLEPGQVLVQPPDHELTPQTPLHSLSSPSRAEDGG